MYVLCAQSYQYLQTRLDNLTPSCAHHGQFTHERVPDQTYTLKFTASQLVYMTVVLCTTYILQGSVCFHHVLVVFCVLCFVFCVCVCVHACVRVTERESE